MRWATARPRQHHPTDALSEVFEKIVVRAWECREDSAVLEGLVPLVGSFLRGGFDLVSHDEVLRGEAFRERAGRRRLVERLVASVADGSLKAWHVVHATPRLLDGGDVPWLTEHLTQTVDGSGTSSSISPSTRAGSGHHHHFQSDLTTFPGWQAADEPTRGRIIVAADRYVAQWDPAR